MPEAQRDGDLDEFWRIPWWWFCDFRQLQLEFHAFLYHAMNVCGTQSESVGLRWVSGPSWSLYDDMSGPPLENRTADSKVRFFPPHQRNYEGYAQARKNPLWHRNLWHSERHRIFLRHSSASATMYWNLKSPLQTLQALLADANSRGGRQGHLLRAIAWNCLSDLVTNLAGR